MDVLAICGSLRRESFNRALLQAAIALAPPGLCVREFELEQIPLFNADLEEGIPASVAAFMAALRAADAILIATPEYNRSVPGLLKNALDWASRPPLFSVLRGKPIAIIGASTGHGGTWLAQTELRRVLGSTGAIVLPGPTLALGRAHTKFAHGQLIDQDAESALVELLEGLLRRDTPQGPQSLRSSHVKT